MILFFSLNNNLYITNILTKKLIKMNFYKILKLFYFENLLKI